VTFFGVSGALSLAWWGQRGGRVLLVISGLCFGLALLMKQPGIVFVCYGIVIVLIRRREGGFSISSIGRDVLWFLGGVAAPILLVLVWLAVAGALGKFFFLNFGYGIDFGNRIAIQDAIPQFLQALPPAMHAFWIVWVLAGIGLVLYLTAEVEGSPQVQFLLFSVAALAGAGLGFQFRMHSFVMFLPVISMLAGYCVFGVHQIMVERNIHGILRAIPPMIVVVALGFGLIVDRDYFFADDVRSLSRKMYFPNPFADAEQIGDYLRSQTGPGDKISILGSEPEILYRAGRKSASPYLFMSSFTNPPGRGLEMEQEMLAGIEHASPAYIVYVRQPFSWRARTEAETYITDWAGGYLQKNYELEGMAEMHSPSETRFRWGADARSAPAGAVGSVLIFRRR
jgi:TM2 domain-containing membrane protein YozV